MEPDGGHRQGAAAALAVTVATLMYASPNPIWRC